DATNKRLVAWVVGTATPDEIKAHIARTLPAYMIPVALVSIDALPLNTTGKLDRKALPLPDLSSTDGEQITPAPDDLVGQMVLLQAREVLDGGAASTNASRFGLEADFFALGGHSLLATRFTARLRNALGIDVPVRLVFEHPRLLDLAQVLRSSTARDHTEVAPPQTTIAANAVRITPEQAPLADLNQAEIDGLIAVVPGGAANIQDIYPLTPLQEGLLFVHRLDPEADPYALQVWLRADSRAHLDAWIHTLQGIVDRHDIWRTAFHDADLSHPVQVVLRQAPIHQTFLALPECSNDDVAARALVEENATTWIDIHRAPLMYVTAAGTADGPQTVLLQFHHLVSDHVGLEIMAHEAALLARGETLPPPVPFRDFAWRSRHSVSEEAHRTFFSEMLAHIDTPTAPFGIAHAQSSGDDIAEAHVRIEPELAARMRAAASSAAVPPAALAHLAWALVLSRLCGQDKVVFGTVLFGRLQGGQGVESAMGLFINTLPIAVDLRNQTATQALTHVAKRLVSLIRHEHAPLSVAKSCAGVGASAELFTTLFNYRHSTTPAQDASETAFTPGVTLVSTRERTNYPFSLSMDDLGSGFALSAQSIEIEGIGWTAQALCDLMCEALTQIITSVENKSQRPILALPLRTTVAIACLDRWTKSQSAPLPDPLPLVHQRFEQQVALRPYATALLFEDQTLTYGALDARADRLARHLVALGVGPESRVAIVLNRGFDLIVAILATLKAGGAYVPLDPTWPTDRIRYAVEDSYAKIVLTQASLTRQVDAVSSNVPCICTDAPSIVTVLAQLPAAPPARAQITPGQLAYVIYTSGSTGRPKGVGVTHGNVAALLQRTDRSFTFGPDDAWTLFHSTTFDFSVWEIWGALTHGGRLVIVPQEARTSPDRFIDLLHHEKVTVLNQTPSAFQNLLLAIQARQAHDTMPALHLREIIFGGEALDLRAVAPYLQMGGPGRLVNMYGITETTVHVTFEALTEALIDAHPHQSVIGTPIDGWGIEVWDAHGNPTPVGVWGEIVVSGEGLARGYLEQPGLTADRFIAGPEGTRRYRSGDRGRWLSSGRLEHGGRLDHQVKIRGFRIETGEIEAAILGCAGVLQAVVLAIDDPADATNKRLVAWVVGTATSNEIKRHIAGMLPSYMIPAAIVAIDALPLTANGKLDRKALPAPTLVSEGLQRLAPDPDDLVGQMVLLQAQEVLGGGTCALPLTFGLEADFFATGGHSLLATRFTARLRHALGIDVPVRLVFEHPRLLDLATRLKALLSSEAHREDPEARVIAPLAHDAPKPASSAQQRLWFIDQFEQERGNQAYLMPAMSEIEGAINPSALQHAFAALVQRHASLRTLLVEHDSAVWQHVVDPDRPVLSIEETTPRDQAIMLARTVLLQPFRLAEDIPIRAVLIPVAPEPTAGTDGKDRPTDAYSIKKWILGLVLHHTAADGWSIPILLRDLSRLYASACTGEDPALPPLRVSYADFAAWQRRYLSGARLTAQLDGWKQTLAGVPVCTPIATDHPRPPRQSMRGGAYARVIGSDVTQAFERGVRAHGATLYMGLLAAWAHVLQRHGAGDDIVIGSPTANRTHPDLEPIVGMFVNTLPLRLDLSDAHTFERLLDHVRERCVQAWARQDVPFENIVESLDLPRSLSHPPLVQLMLTLQNNEQANLHLGDVLARPVDLGQRIAKVDLSLSAAQTAEGLALDIEYAADLFEPLTVSRIADRLAATIGTIAAHLTHDGAATRDTSLQLHRCDLLTPDERDILRVLSQGASTAPLPDPLPLVHQRFEERAALRPHATALVFEDQTLTYGVLDARANQLARHLVALGVGPDARVAIVMDRGLDLLAAILGTLKAGGAYVPLDPSWPTNRITDAVQDSKARVVLTLEAIRHDGVLKDQRESHETSTLDVICLDSKETRRVLDGRANTPPDRGTLSPQNLAYVIYTSGSTGKPKGVAVTHAQWTHLCRNQVTPFEVSTALRTLAWASIGFDASVFEFGLSLGHGGTFILPRAEHLKDSALLFALLERFSVTHLTIVPSALHALTEGTSAEVLAEALPALQTIVVAGEPCPVPLANLWASNRQLINAYGPTEATVCTTTCQITPDVLTRAIERSNLPIGPPVDHVTVHVLDAHLNNVPIGVPGELYIGGAQVARGYLDRPGLTADRFVADPFTLESRGARMYRTGDLVRWNAHGELEFLGRIDHQVKI
ncbi:MAG: amino acid adenylation domain-containing protein, partial [Proteobacteria bacterium]|nr:amino acid adenylation domain-containing protein [Pseudomonadota bacterium]